MKKQTRKINANSVPIISDGAISTPDCGDRRLIPVLVIDCNGRPDIRDLIYSHEYLPPGDVKVTWGRKAFQYRSVLLLLEFIRPSEVIIPLEFKMQSQGTLVEGILHSKAVYLQPLESGKKVTEGIDKTKILVEIPDTGFFPEWDKLHTKVIKKTFREKGLSKKAANLAAKEHLGSIREIWQLHRYLSS